MELENGPVSWWKTAECCCGESTLILDNNSCIKVNCYSKGEVKIPGMWGFSKFCDNPLCEWSKLGGNDED